MARGAPDHRLVIDLVELVKLITKIEEITKVAEITTLKNLESLDLVDRITRIDSIDSLGEISIAKVVPLISPPLLLHDDFNSGILKWKGLGDGRLELSNEWAFSGSGSMRIYTGPLVTMPQSARRRFATSVDLTMRLMHRFSFSSSGVDWLWSSIVRFSGSQALMGEVRYLPTDKKWQYRTGVATWTDIPGGAQDIYADLDIWHHLTLECDFSTKKFVQLKVDALTIDMSALDLLVGTDERAEYAEIYIGIDAASGQIVEEYVDDVLVEAW